MAVLSASPVVTFDGLRTFPRRFTVQLSPAASLVIAVLGAFVVALVVSVAFGQPAPRAQATSGQMPVVAETAAYPAWTVTTGDTLWTIASRTRPQADPRAVVLQIQVLNGITSDHVLQAGEVLQLPVD